MVFNCNNNASCWEASAILREASGSWSPYRPCEAPATGLRAPGKVGRVRKRASIGAWLHLHHLNSVWHIHNNLVHHMFNSVTLGLFVVVDIAGRQLHTGKGCLRACLELKIMMHRRAG